MMIVRSANLRVKQPSRRSVNFPNIIVFVLSLSSVKSNSRLYSKGAPTGQPSSATRQRIPFFDSSHNGKPALIKTHACEQLLGYQFREPLLLWEALQVNPSTGYRKHMPRYLEANKRLAIVGDRVLGLLVAVKWYPTWGTRGDCGPRTYNV